MQTNFRGLNESSKKFGLGPAIVWNQYRGMWIYLLAPTLGAIAGVWVHNLVRFIHTDKSLKNSFLIKKNKKLVS